MCLYTSLLDLKEWSYDTDQANYQIFLGFHFPPTHYHGSCESNPFICLKMTYPLSFFSIVVEQTLVFPLTECMYTVKRNSDCRTMTTFVNHCWHRIINSKGRAYVLKRFEVKSFCEILSLEKNYNNWANKWYLMGDHYLLLLLSGSMDSASQL